MRWHHYLCKLARLLRLAPRDLAAAASEVVEVCPAERSEVPPAIVLPGQLEKARGVPYGTSWLQERQRIRGGVVEHYPTLACRFERAVIDRGTIRSGLYEYHANGARVIGPEASASGHLENAALASTAYGQKYFGHWLTDNVPLLMLARDFGEPVVVSDCPYPHAAAYLGSLGLGCCRTVLSADVRNLVIFRDAAQNSLKRRRYVELRRRLGTEEADAGTCVYIRRGRSGALRLLVNESEVERHLESRGFDVVDPSAMPAAELIGRMRGARVVVGVEGSSLAHAVYTLSRRGVLVVIQPPCAFNNIHKDYCDCLGMRYATVVAEGDRRGFRLEPADLLATVDLCLRSCESAQTITNLQ